MAGDGYRNLHPTGRGSQCHSHAVVLACFRRSCSQQRTKQTAASAGLRSLLRHMLRERCHIELASFSNGVDVTGILGMAEEVEEGGEEGSSGHLLKKKTTWKGKGGGKGSGGRAVMLAGWNPRPKEPPGLSGLSTQIMVSCTFMYTLLLDWLLWWTEPQLSGAGEDHGQGHLR